MADSLAELAHVVRLGVHILEIPPPPILTVLEADASGNVHLHNIVI